MTLCNLPTLSVNLPGMIHIVADHDAVPEFLALESVHVSFTDFAGILAGSKIQFGSRVLD